MTIVYLPLCFYFTAVVLGFRMPVGAPCNISNSHLDGNTKAFVSDCDWFGFCSTDGICLPRGCRRDRYVLSSLLESNKTIPPLCKEGTFCPDDASTCLPLVPVGGHCQLNRDDECLPPGGNVKYAIPNEWDQTTGNCAICLEGICMYTNVSLGQSCLHETTTYIGYDVSGTSVTNEIIRDNCIEGEGCCDLDTSVCVALRDISESCVHDRDCKSYNCGESKICLLPPESTIRIAKWIYAVAGLSLSAAMGGILIVLIMIHNKTQREKMARLEAYRKEQLEYRKSILSFHTTLLASESKLSFDGKDKEKSNAKPLFRRGMYRSESMDSRQSSLLTN